MDALCDQAAASAAAAAQLRSLLEAERRGRRAAEQAAAACGAGRRAAWQERQHLRKLVGELEVGAHEPPGCQPCLAWGWGVVVWDTRG